MSPQPPKLLLSPGRALKVSVVPLVSQWAVTQFNLQAPGLGESFSFFINKQQTILLINLNDSRLSLTPFYCSVQNIPSIKNHLH